MRSLLSILCLLVFSCDSDSTINQEDDFTSILITNEFGEAHGYEGNEDNYGGCIPVSDLTISYPYPNPSNQFFIGIETWFNSADITITVINDSYEYINTLFDSTIPGFDQFTIYWSGFDFNYNQTPNGYYRMIINSSNGDEICYFNLKKLP